MRALLLLLLLLLTTDYLLLLIQGLLLQLIASFPLIAVRALFFTVLLACMLPELDEFMLVKYILLLKVVSSK